MPQFQSRFAPLGQKLDSLGLPGVDRVQSLSKDIADVLFTDASDATERLGGEGSNLYGSLKWAGEVDVAFKQGLENTIKNLRLHRREIIGLPDSGVPGRLRQDLAEEMIILDERLAMEDFYKHITDLNSTLTNLQAHVRNAAVSMGEAQKMTIIEAEEDLRRLPEWTELTREEQNDMLAKIEDLQVEVTQNLQGLKQLVNQEFVAHSRLSEMKRRIVQQGQQRQKHRIEEEKEKAKKDGKTKITRTVKLPSAVSSADQLNTLIQQLKDLKNELEIYTDIEVIITIED